MYFKSSPRLWIRLAPLALCPGLLVFCAPARAAGPDRDGYIELFDGKTLNGWGYDSNYWRVEGGAMVGLIPEGQSLNHNTWMIWEEGVLDDFELRLQFKLTGAAGANSGIQFRCQAESVNKVSGYQADLDAGATWLGRIYDEHGRALLVERGTRVSIDAGGGRLVERFADPGLFHVLFREQEWNEYRIRASGEHITTEVNGTVFGELIDRQTGERDLSGQLALQLHSGPHTRIEFRSIRLRKLQPGGHKVVLEKTAEPAPEVTGVVPAAADGRKLNLGFEDGTLGDWTARGEAFRGQPVMKDTISQRWAGQVSGKEGTYFIGGFELLKDAPKGELISVAFPVSHPYGSFRFAGGSERSTRVEVILAGEPDQVIQTVSGANREEMTRFAVDLRAHQGRNIYLKVVDENDGAWGHLNFDDFRFHQTKPVEVGSAGGGRQDNNPILSHLLPNPNPKIGQGPGSETVRQMYLEPGFTAEVVAAEPALHQPIAFTFDDRGRIWVAEAHSYPQKRPAGEGLDRILIFEDGDGDGEFETRKVFVEGLNLVSGLEVGHGGVWIGAAPELLFIPDRDGNDQPDGEPEVLLDGFGYQDTHETINNLIWGPDGWLYGNQGVFNYARIGKPGQAEGDRTALSAGVWRYHPGRREFEVFAHGGSNQWGLDFNEAGQLFMTHCRSYWGRGLTTHVIQGGHYWNQSNRGYVDYVSDTAPSGYEFFRNYLLASARYGHGEGGAGKPGSRAVYGGHSHVGTMLYLGDNWPDEYRDRLFTHNLHGHQLNHQENRREGSGYNTVHAGRDPFYCADPRYVAVDLKYGPDGAVYVIDWYDQQHCHNPNTERWERGTGRLYRMAYASSYKPVSVNLSQASDAGLVELQLHRNEWFVRTARRLLGERAAAGGLPAAVVQELVRLALSHDDPGRRLRGVWALHAVGGLKDSIALDLLADRDEHVRAWTIQLIAEDRAVASPLMERLARMAQDDPSAVVRLYLASAIQRLPAPEGWRLAETLAGRTEDAADRNLPLMIWYGLAPLMGEDLDRAFRLAGRTKIPVLPHYIHWYAAKRQGEGLNRVIAVLGREVGQRELIEGVALALAGQKGLKMPAAWPAVAPRLYRSSDARVQHLAHTLGSVFGDQTIFPEMRRVLADPAASKSGRRHAFTILANDPGPESALLFLSLLDDAAFRPEVIRMAGRMNHPETAQALISRFDTFTAAEKAAAINSLIGRESLANALLGAMVEGRVDRKLLTAFHARQLGNLQSGTVDAHLAKVWGKVASTPEAQQKQIAELEKKFVEAPLWAFNAGEGRQHFTLLCASCHKPNNEGGDIGPNLTGSGSNGARYFIENIIDPNAVIGTDYQASSIETRDGELISGLIEKETATAVTIRTVTGSITVPRASIGTLSREENSMMPAGLLDALNERQQIELLKFLQSI